jgi:hypothetical protein
MKWLTPFILKLSLLVTEGNSFRLFKKAGVLLFISSKMRAEIQVLTRGFHNTVQQC